MVIRQFPAGLQESEKRAILRRMLETRALGDTVDASELRQYSQWATDLLLDADTDPQGARPMAHKPGALFLTGATGYLGAFLLHALAARTDAPIHCLVRAPDRPRGLSRIKAKLESYLLWDESLRNRIIAVPGDLSKPNLGLANDQFEALAASVDVIFHVGAIVNFLFSYPDMREANVVGTKEILRLAAMHHLKPLH
ncbi:MAG TPA: SDR family oxidoreductase, partial [Myxococcota bacterium]